MNPDLPAVVIGDVAVIVVACWIFGALARRLGQPTVVGQIVAGLVLGPAVLGQLPGNFTGLLFPSEVQPFLLVLSQVAVVVFMFVAGYETDLRVVRRGVAPLGVAAAALLVPMGMGLGSVHAFEGLFSAVDPVHYGQRGFGLFIAVAVSITALPVLVAIVRERGAAGSRSGAVALSAAALMDVVAWLVLAAALARADKAEPAPWLVTVALLILLVSFLFFVIRPGLRWLLLRPTARLKTPVAAALALALGTAWVTSSLGLHPVFGGFLAGLAMPRLAGGPDARVLRPMEQTANLLLPLFFVVAGLSFDVSSLNGRGLPLLAVLLFVGVVGKMVPAYVASRLGGLDRRESGFVAALVNTRGLTELVVLDVGLRSGVIGGALYTALVVMALITTMMTGPLLSRIERRGRHASPALSAEGGAPRQHVNPDWREQ